MPNIIRLPTVKTRTGLSRSTIYSKIKENSFPAQIPLGLRAVGWNEDEVNSWIDTKIALARDGGKQS